jgi:hypothetical protein
VAGSRDPRHHGRMDDSPLEVLRRWESSGGTWRVVVRTSDRLVLDLATCDGGEVMGRLEAAPPDAELAAHVAEKLSDETGEDDGAVSPGGS